MTVRLHITVLPALSGLYLIGLNKDNLLVVKDIDGMSAADFESYVNEAGIRDAVAFQEESSDSNNHFVPLIINNEARVLKGQGSGANPRTAIGQRADGAILLLVTDGRGASGHLGATASDLISVMQNMEQSMQPTLTAEVLQQWYITVAMR